MARYHPTPDPAGIRLIAPRPAATPCDDPTHEVTPIVRLWMLRLLVPLGGHQRFITRHGLQSEEVAAALGLASPPEAVAGHEPAAEEPEFPRGRVLARLRQLHHEAEAAAATLRVNPDLAANCERLAGKIGLTDTEREILEFTVMLHAEHALAEAAEQLGPLTTARTMRVLAHVLGRPDQDIRQALSGKGALRRCGLVSLELYGFAQDLHGKLELLSREFGARLLAADQDPVDLIRDTVFPSPPATLARANYPHLRDELELLLPYVRDCLDSRHPGVNILVYGTPGTGKSELARLVAQEAGSELFEVASEDSEGDSITGEKRLHAWRAALSLLAHHRALLLFDEVEDLFRDSDSAVGRNSTAQTRKAWINRALETNALPTLWLTNHIQCIDPAVIRRFDLVIPLRVPPRAERERIVRDHAGHLLDAATVARLASADVLSPAVITRAARVVSRVQDRLPAGRQAPALELLISHTLTAQGHAPLPRAEACLPGYYDPRFLNTGVDLAALAGRLRQGTGARLCLYGPPGTGKSA